MKRVSDAGTLILLLAVSGCGGKRSAEPQAAKTGVFNAVDGTNFSGQTNLIITPDTTLIGKVTFVNPNSRFVVLTFPVGIMPAVGQSLSVYRNGLKVGEVKVSGPQNDDNIVADITAGTALVGDGVRSQ